MNRRLCPSKRSTKPPYGVHPAARSEEHTSELQSPCNLLCRLPIYPPFPFTTLFRSQQVVDPNRLERLPRLSREHLGVGREADGLGGLPERVVRAQAGDESAALPVEEVDEASVRRPSGGEIGRAHV